MVISSRGDVDVDVAVDVPFPIVASDTVGVASIPDGDLKGYIH